MSIKEITSLIHKLNGNFIVLFCHHNADPDAVCAAYALSQLLKRLHPQLSVEIAAANGPSKLSKLLLKTLPVTLTDDPRIEDADLIILLDTNTIQQLDNWSERIKTSPSPIIVIDHHIKHHDTENLAKLYVVEEDASSTCEIIYKFFKETGSKLTQKEASALFQGIAFDTKHFTLATSNTFKVVAELIDAGVNAQEALSNLSLNMPLSERVARLKACQRVKLLKISNWLIALSHVSAYQASAARALIRLGAHVAVVAGQRAGRLQVSLRSCREFHKKTGIHLGQDIAEPLGTPLQGMGGGHSTSAGINGVSDVAVCLEGCLKILEKKLT